MYKLSPKEATSFIQLPTLVGVEPKINNCIAKKFCIMENNIRRVRKAKIFIEKVKANRLMQESTRGQF